MESRTVNMIRQLSSCTVPELKKGGVHIYLMDGLDKRVQEAESPESSGGSDET